MRHRFRLLLLAIGLLVGGVGTGMLAFPATALEPAPSDELKKSPPKDENPLLQTPPWRPVESRGQVKQAIDRGCNYLIDNQNDNGSYGRFDWPDVGVTALVLQALAGSPRQYREGDGPFITKAVALLKANVQDDGGIYNPNLGLENYKTSVSILALTELDRGRPEPRYSNIVAKAAEFVRSLQCDEGRNYQPGEHKNSYGGIGYGSDRKPDMSNLQMSLEALRAAGLAEDSEEFRKAVKFIHRSQNIGSNDLFEDENFKSTGDGGLMYSPGSTKADTVKNSDGTVSYSSYGSMTYAGVKSYIFAGLETDDPRVQAAWKWIQSNYTVEVNPGMESPKNPLRGYQGLFYYYLVMARTFDVLGVKEITTSDGKTHRWAEELAGKLISLQDRDGSWVNRADRWLEGDPAVVTAYAVRALSICYKAIDR